MKTGTYRSEHRGFGEFAFLDKPIIYYRQHPAQITANHGGDYAISPLRNKTVRSLLNTPHQRKTAILAWRARMNSGVR